MSKVISNNLHHRNAVIHVFAPIEQIPRIAVTLVIVCTMLLSPVLFSNDSPLHTREFCMIPSTNKTDLAIKCPAKSSIPNAGCSILFNVTVNSERRRNRRSSLISHDCKIAVTTKNAQDCFLDFLVKNGEHFKCAKAVSVAVWPRFQQSNLMRTMTGIKTAFHTEMMYVAVLMSVLICFALVIIVTLQCTSMRYSHKTNTIFSRVPDAFQLDENNKEALYIVNFDKEQYYSMKYIKAYSKRGSIHVSPRVQTISPIYKLNIHPSLPASVQEKFAENTKYYMLLSSTSIWHDETIIWIQKVDRSYGFPEIRKRAIIISLVCFCLSVGAFVVTHSVVEFRSMYVLPFLALIFIACSNFFTHLVNYLGGWKTEMVLTDRRIILAGRDSAFLTRWIRFLNFGDIQEVESDADSNIYFNTTNEFAEQFPNSYKSKPFVLPHVENVDSITSRIRELIDEDADRTDQSVTNIKFDAKEIPEEWIENIDQVMEY